MPSFKSVLVANRGEIAVRVMRTAKRMGLRTVAVYSDADRNAPHVHAADEAVHIGGAMSYLDVDAVLRAPGDAIHPGYGFLSENPGFAESVQKSGRVWIGPPPAAIHAMGDKANAKAVAAKAGVPILPTYDTNPEFPLMIKALAGGGGRGIRIVNSDRELPEALKTAQSEAQHAFGDSRVLLEKALLAPRHIEVQVFADTHGNCIHLGERDCSVQRRHQKLIEESPSPAVDAKLRARMGNAAASIAMAVGYVGAGTVEFLLGEDGKFWFMEMNTRLQVEHPVTEALTGLDLVEWQLRVASGERLPLTQDQVRFEGHAIEARLCAENPARNFLPQSGTLGLWQGAQGVRIDHALESGIPVAPYYDSMLAKLIAHAPTRDAARQKLADALDATVALGLPTNKAFLAAVLRDGRFASGDVNTGFLSDFKFKTQEPDFQVAAALLAAEHGEWTGWSNNPAHSSRAKFDGQVISFSAKEKPDIPHYVDGDAVCYGDVCLRNSLYDPPQKRGVAASDGRLAAPMNGRVVAVNARAGDRIEAGKPLVVLEAMKMEHGLDLPFAVRIKAVHAKAGSQVAPGHLLVEFEPA